MHLALALIDRADTDDGPDVDTDRLSAEVLGLSERFDDSVKIVRAIKHVDDVPASRAQLGRGIVGEAAIDRSVHGDGIVVIDEDQIV